MMQVIHDFVIYKKCLVDLKSVSVVYKLPLSRFSSNMRLLNPTRSFYKGQNRKRTCTQSIQYLETQCDVFDDGTKH